ncbi:4-(cytidine 5'-diphospho)-2-C-methyl-D-erythritol kinase [Candidatus Omnitrophota bacterium]
MEFTAPAKVNLYLKVLKKREDGFHQIETLFERISIKDRLFVEKTTGESVIECDDPEVPTSSDSLLAKTIGIFREKTGLDASFRVKLEKNIPIGAGLGGGSSDAASLLTGINELSGAPLAVEELLEAARTLGSDVPFFVKNCPFAVGTERGDVVKKVESEAKLWHVIVNPPFEVATGSVYGKLSDFGLTKEGPADRMFSAFLSEHNINRIAENLHNDLQQIVLRDFPALNDVFSELENIGAKGVLLSGSGPTVFGIFTDRDEADGAALKLRKAFPEEEAWRVYTAHTC